MKECKCISCNWIGHEHDLKTTWYDQNKSQGEELYLCPVCQGIDTIIKIPDSLIKPEKKIIVTVEGGIAYCDDPQVEIIDHDRR